MYNSPVKTTARYLPGSPRLRYKMASQAPGNEVENSEEPKEAEKPEENEETTAKPKEEVESLKKPASKKPAKAAAQKKTKVAKDSTKAFSKR